jgi:hypothetical protein
MDLLNHRKRLMTIKKDFSAVFLAFIQTTEPDPWRDHDDVRRSQILRNRAHGYET